MTDEWDRDRRLAASLGIDPDTQLTLIRALIESTRAGCLVETVDHRVVAVNHAFCEMFSISDAPMALHGSRTYALASRTKRLFADSERFVGRVEEIVSRRQPLGAEELAMQDGRTLERDYQPVLGLEGRVLGHVWQYRDVTEHRQQSRMLHEMELRLRQTRQLETVGRLAGGVTHDFNNLLMVIMGYAELLMAGLENHPARKEEALRIWRAGRRATTLTRRLLTFGRTRGLEPRVLDPNGVIRDIKDLLNRLVREDIEIEYVLDPALECVQADPGQLEQLLVNLLVNACDAMPDGGRVVIETANVAIAEDHAGRGAEIAPGPYIRLSVTDPGTASEPRHPDFDGQGTGFGLSAVHAIVEESGGSIRVESEPERGTSFEVYLPRVRRDAPSPSTEAVSTDLVSGTETVLVVEDAGAVRDVVGEVLRRCGYVVLEAEEPRQASELSEHHPGPIDLLVTDVVMPGMSGRELAERVRAIHRDIKTLYMSGYGADTIGRRGVPEWDAALVEKPVSPGELARKVREILDSRGRGGRAVD